MTKRQCFLPEGRLHTVALRVSESVAEPCACEEVSNYGRFLLRDRLVLHINNFLEHQFEHEGQIEWNLLLHLRQIVDDLGHVVDDSGRHKRLEVLCTRIKFHFFFGPGCLTDIFGLKLR